MNSPPLWRMVPRGLEPRTLRLLAVRSNQLSYETSRVMLLCRSYCSEARVPATGSVVQLQESCHCALNRRSVETWLQYGPTRA